MEGVNTTITTKENNKSLDQLGFYGPVWYMCLKTENYCLKIFMKLHVGEKVCRNTYNVI